MNSFKSYSVILATALIVIGIVVSSFLTEYNTVIASVTTTITAVIGAVALFFQFKKDKEINKASFLLEFSKQFYEIYDCLEIFNLIEKSVDDVDFDLYKELSKPYYMLKIENYLSWCMTLASLVRKGTVSILDIDALFNYRFFAVVNNKAVQDLELIKYYNSYIEVINLYKIWRNFRIKHKKEIPFSSSDLCENAEYKKLFEIRDWFDKT